MKKSISIFAVLLLSLMAFAMLPPSAAQGYTIEELWTNPMQVNDVAVSKDGNFVAAVNDTGLYYFGWDSPTPRWWYLSGGEDRFLSVAISANGQYVIMGNSTNGSVYYFGGCTIRTGPQASSDWVSKQFIYYPPAGNNDVERRTIDISDNGEYVVVGGTGDRIYYFMNCTTNSGNAVNYTWNTWTWFLVHAVDMSPDGRYVVAGGPDAYSSAGVVDFFSDANLPGPHSGPTWENHTLTRIVDVAVSDDGYSVSAVSPLTGVPATLYYWTGATSRTGANNPANWTRLHGFSSVDMSSDGNRVVAGYAATNVGSLHYWDGALTLSGNNVIETWVRVPDTYVFDVGISDDGGLILAGTGLPNCALFYTSDGILVGNFTLEAPAAIVSMAGSGSSAAVGTGRLTTSLHFYKITTIANAVGGEILSLEGLMLLAPYLAVALVAAVAVAIVLVFSSRRTLNH